MAYAERVRHPGLHRQRDEPMEGQVAEPVVRDNYGLNVLTRAIWFVAGVVLALLAFRFVLALGAANPANGFASFIYTTSHPFVTPFFNLFNYGYLNGLSRFEAYTLVAMAVYAVIAWGLAALVNIGRR
jgi:hypothetical protein